MVVRPPMYREPSVVVVVVVVVVALGAGRLFFLPWELLNDDLISLLLSVVKRLRLVVPGRLRDLDGFLGRLGAAMSLAPML